MPYGDTDKTGDRYQKLERVVSIIIAAALVKPAPMDYYGTINADKFLF
jgi:hypothetical protein